MLSFHLVGRRLGDYIDQNDPCTTNPSDPICQATAADTAQDPCVLNPNASYCQAAIVKESASLPTPGSSDTSWLSFLEPAAAAGAAVVAAGSKPSTPTLKPAQVPGASAASASLSTFKPSMPMLIGLGVIVLGFLAIRRRRMAA